MCIFEDLLNRSWILLSRSLLEQRMNDFAACYPLIYSWDSVMTVMMVDVYSPGVYDDGWSDVQKTTLQEGKRNNKRERKRES